MLEEFIGAAAPVSSSGNSFSFNQQSNSSVPNNLQVVVFCPAGSNQSDSLHHLVDVGEVEEVHQVSRDVECVVAGEISVCSSLINSMDLLNSPMEIIQQYMDIPMPISNLPSDNEAVQFLEEGELCGNAELIKKAGSCVASSGSPDAANLVVSAPLDDQPAAPSSQLVLVDDTGNHFLSHSSGDDVENELLVPFLDPKTAKKIAKMVPTKSSLSLSFFPLKIRKHRELGSKARAGAMVAINAVVEKSNVQQSLSSPDSKMNTTSKMPDSVKTFLFADACKSFAWNKRLTEDRCLSHQVFGPFQFSKEGSFQRIIGPLSKQGDFLGPFSPPVEVWAPSR